MTIYYFILLSVSIVYRIVHRENYDYQDNNDFMRYFYNFNSSNIGHKMRKVEEGYFFLKYQGKISFEKSLDVDVQVYKFGLFS